MPMEAVVIPPQTTILKLAFFFIYLI